MAEIEIREAREEDIPALAEVYNEQVRTSMATFDIEELGTAYLSGKLADRAPGNVFLTALRGREVLGYALSSSFRPRPAYNGTKETSVYLAPEARGQGVGASLYAELLTRMDAIPEVHTLVAVIALPNDASEALHRRFGYRHVGTLQEVGHKFGRYVDTAWYQRHA